MLESDFDLAIKRGKHWMGHSFDDVHDFDHIESVWDSCLEIAKERGIKEKDMKLLEIAVWWHDSSKAVEQGFSFRSLVLEGKESEEIVRREIGDCLSDDDLETVCSIVRNHSNSFLYFLFNKDVPVLLRVLYEADSLDEFKIERYRKAVNRNGYAILDIPFYIYTWYRRNTFGRLKTNSQYTMNVLTNFNDNN